MQADSKFKIMFKCHKCQLVTDKPDQRKLGNRVLPVCPRCSVVMTPLGDKIHDPRGQGQGQGGAAA